MPSTKAAKFVLMLTAAASVSVAADQYPDSSWDVTAARGQVQEIAFDINEGTWMSVDVDSGGTWLVFDLLGDLYRVPATTGGTAECLTCDSGQAINYHPTFSPDGSRIAFVSDRKGQSNLWIAQSDGSSPKPVFLDNDSRIVEPVWMPDGKSIIATRRFRTEMGFYRVRAEIWVFPVDRSLEPRRLVAHEGWQRHWPSPSADGKYVYYHTMNSFGQLHQIKRINLGNGKIDDVTNRKTLNLTYPTYSPPLGEFAPEVSPDGRFLAFARKIPAGKLSFGDIVYEGRTALWLRDLRTGAERILADPITTDASDFHFLHKARVLPGYSWSGDSKTIYFTSGGQLRRVTVETGDVQTIPFEAHVSRVASGQTRFHGRLEAEATFKPRTIRWPRRSPDGRQLAFEAAGRVYVWDFDERAPRPVGTMAGVSQAMPAWSHDSEWLAFVTLDASDAGSIWRVRRDGSDLAKLASSSGSFIHPIWDEDGDSIIASNFIAQTPAFDRTLDDRWQIVRVAVAPPESIEVLRASGPAASGWSWRDRRIDFSTLESSGGDQRALLAAGLPIPPASTNLVTTDLSGSNVTIVGKVFGSALGISPSPSGRWAVVKKFRELYLVPLDDSDFKGASGPGIDLLESANVRRLTFDSGAYANWLSGDVLEFASGNEYRTYDARNDKTTSIEVPLRLSRDVPSGSLFLHGGTVIVGDEKGTIVHDADLLVQDGRFQCIGKCKAPTEATRMSFKGRFIIPGWVDIHTHHLVESDDGLVPSKRSSSASYLAHGVTTTSDPGIFNPFVAAAIADMAEAGHIIGPRTLSQGDFIRCYGTATNQRSTWDNIRPITSLKDARELVARHKKWGATLLKSYQLCTRSQRQMLVEAAREEGLGVTVEAQDIGFVLGGIIDGHTGWEHWLQYLPIYDDVSTMFGQLATHYSAQMYQAGYPAAGSTEYWAGLRDWWSDDKIRRFQPWRHLATRRAPSGKSVERFSWPILAKGVADIAAKGGYAPLGGHSELAGIDSHWEIWAMASATGNARALRAASYDGAHFLGLEQDLGTIETGKIADFVVLSGNPLVDIRNTTAIDSVSLRGVLYDGETLDEKWPESQRFGDYPWMGPDRLYFSDTVRSDSLESRAE